MSEFDPEQDQQNKPLKTVCSAPGFQARPENMKHSFDSYIPALRYRWLTRFYDPVVRTVARENTFKQALLRQSCIQSGYRVLDLGCGTGTLASMIKQANPSAEVFGLDADREILEFAKLKLARLGLEVQFDEGLASALPYPSASFDRVLSSLFFHHLSSKSKNETMLEVHRVLRPGGEFHIADWGKPTNPFMRLSFLTVQMLDGFATTRDNVNGVLPDMLSLAGFEKVGTTRRYATVLGTLSLYSAHRPFS